MKKTAIIGIVILFAMFVVTCDEFQFPWEENKVEYTDVVYSEDGSRVTIYLDGVGVPLTAAQRAMSTRLSKMAYDYLEVIFANGSATGTKIYARAQWELGQSAGISGVARGTTTTPIDYVWATGKNPASADIALLAVGRKEGKTLLGIGRIGEVDNSNGSTALGADGYPTTIVATVGPNSKSVTFYVEAVKTGLIPATATTDSAAATATFNSFSEQASAPTPPVASPGLTPWVGSTHTKLGSSYIPTYPLPTTSGATTDAFYVFTGAAATYEKEIIGAKVSVEPRFPRYLDNGGYKQLSAAIDMRSDVILKGTRAAFSSIVPLTFTTKGTGIFSFYIEIPVQILTTEKGTNTGKLDPVNWKIRTGLGSELYSLDDGVSGGGCVLMTIGKLELEDWLEIQWEWLP